MTEPEDHPVDLSDPALWARAIGCSVSSIEAWWKDHEDADIPQHEMDLIRQFLHRAYTGCNCCGSISFNSTVVPNPPSQQEQRRRRLEKRAAARARAAAPRLLPYEKG